MIIPSDRLRLRQAGHGAGLPFFLIFTLLWLSSSVEAVPVRGGWVVRHDITTPERVRQVVDTADRAGTKTLFVQVRGRGDAYYQSALVPIAEDVEEGFDPLGAVLSEARTRGMTVHAWFNVYLTWSQARWPELIWAPPGLWTTWSAEGWKAGIFLHQTTTRAAICRLLFMNWCARTMLMVFIWTMFDTRTNTMTLGRLQSTSFREPTDEMCGRWTRPTGGPGSPGGASRLQSSCNAFIGSDRRYVRLFAFLQP